MYFKNFLKGVWVKIDHFKREIFEVDHFPLLILRNPKVSIFTILCKVSPLGIVVTHYGVDEGGYVKQR